MGDGGVACMPLQYTMERLSSSEKTHCGGSSGDGFNSKLLKFSDGERKNMKSRKSELALDRVNKRSGSDVENGEMICGDKAQKEEVEEGELVTLKWPRSEVETENGEFVPEMNLPSRRSEIENEEIVSDRWKTREFEKGEFHHGKWRRDDVERREIVHEKGRRGENEYGPWRGVKDDVEKGEYISDRWYNGSIGKNDYGNSSHRRNYSGKDKGWKFQCERTPPSWRYTGDDSIRKKEFISRSGNPHAKSSPRWENAQQRNIRNGSKIVDDEKNAYNNGKDHTRDYTSGSRLKRLGNDFDSYERKHSADFTSSKSRRLSDESYPYSENYSRRPVEQSYRNNNSTRLSAEKYSSRNHESSLSTRPTYDRHERSPVHSEWSPRDRSRYYDHRDRTPVRRSPFSRERSPYSREKSPHGRERSPYTRSWDRSRQHDHKLKSPARTEQSPQNQCWRQHDHKMRSPAFTEQSPQDQGWRQHSHKLRSPARVEQLPEDQARHHDHRDCTPNLVEGSHLDQTRKDVHDETSCKNSECDKQNSPNSCKSDEDKNIQRESSFSVTESRGERNVQKKNKSSEKDISDSQPVEEQKSCSPTIDLKESPYLEPQPPPNEFLSMEEDMDICDTRPHVPVVTNLSSGKWFYLDYGGVENGPAKLCDIKFFVDEGVLMSDHFIKHLDSDR